MQQVLHIIVGDRDDFVDGLLAEERRNPNCAVDIVELNTANPDYTALLEKIFAADSLQVW